MIERIPGGLVQVEIYVQKAQPSCFSLCEHLISSETLHREHRSVTDRGSSFHFLAPNRCRGHEGLEVGEGRIW